MMTQAARLARETFEVLDPGQLLDRRGSRNPNNCGTSTARKPRTCSSCCTTSLTQWPAASKRSAWHAVPDGLTPRLEAVCTELAGSTMRLHWLARDSQRAAAPGQATVADSTTFPSRQAPSPSPADQPRRTPPRGAGPIGAERGQLSAEAVVTTQPRETVTANQGIRADAGAACPALAAGPPRALAVLRASALRKPAQ